jgi:hypothetical protein
LSQEAKEKVTMMERKCIVVFNEATGRSTGQIMNGDEVVKELSFYLGKLHSTEPEVAEELIRSRYTQWAGVYGVNEIQVEFKRD